MPKPNCLLQSVASLPIGQPLIVGDGPPLLVGTVVQAALAWRRVAGAGCVGQNFVVSFKSAAGLTLALAALDGFAASIVLAPSSLAPTDLVDFARVAGAGVLMTDGEPVLGLSSISGPEILAGTRASPGGEVPPTDVTTAWLLATSGTTGTPKLYSHTFGSLTAAARRTSARSAEFIWGLLYDAHRFAGLQVLLQCVVGGSPLCAPRESQDIVALVAAFYAHGVNSLSATPSLWRRLLMTPAASDLPLRQITLGGEIVEQGMLDALRAAYPAARIVHIYACTEAGVAFSVKDGKEGFPRDYLSASPSGVELQVDAEGILHIRPLGVRPHRVAALADEIAADGFIRTGDRVELVGDRVRFLGRASGTINVGGLKVQPEEVERVLMTYPDVVLVRVQGRGSSIAGQLVEAEIGLRKGAVVPSGFAQQIRAHCARHLPPYKVPALIRIVTDLRITAAGKLDRTSSA